jgi:hypothetical protein
MNNNNGFNVNKNQYIKTSIPFTQNEYSFSSKGILVFGIA